MMNRNAVSPTQGDQTLRVTAQAEELARECDALCQAVFGFEAPTSLQEAYREAHAVVFADPDLRPDTNGESRMIAEAVRGRHDLEALEFAQRTRDKNNQLTKKMGILFYLVEASPIGYRQFVNPTDSVLTGYTAMAYHVVRSAYKWGKGRLLVMMLTRAPGRVSTT